MIKNTEKSNNTRKKKALIVQKYFQDSVKHLLRVLLQNLLTYTLRKRCHSVHWGLNPALKTPPPSFLPIPLKSANSPSPPF